MSTRHYVDGAVTPEFGQFIVELAEVWGARLSEARIRQYAQLLSGWPMDALRRAGTSAARELSFFPAPSQLLDFLRPKADDAALLSYAALERAAALGGAWMDAHVDDGAAARAVEVAFGGWPEFCQMDDGPQRTQKRQEFLAAYRVARVHEPGPVRLPGLCSRSSGDTVGHVVRVLAGRVEVVRADRLVELVRERRALNE